MSQTKSGCNRGAAAEAGVIGEQVASEQSELATYIYICIESTSFNLECSWYLCSDPGICTL